MRCIMPNNTLYSSPLEYSMLTVYDIASRLNDADQKRAQHFESTMGIHLSKKKFYPIKTDEESYVLFPAELDLLLYRGQCQYYNPCRPSLYREKLTKIGLFVERLRYSEFRILLETHPAINDLANSKLEFMSTLHINKLALAQHYGLKTELIDFTSDPFIAAFFAVTKYNITTKKYEPIFNNYDGVYYIHKPSLIDIEPYNKRRLQAVGLYPIHRPGEQKAYSYLLFENECLNKLNLFKQIRFKHEKKTTLKIFDIFEGGEKLFPFDPIQDKADAIISANAFSEKSFYLTNKEYKQYDIKRTKKELKKININISNDVNFSFSEKEFDGLSKSLKNEEDNFFSKIETRYCF